MCQRIWALAASLSCAFDGSTAGALRRSITTGMDRTLAFLNGLEALRLLLLMWQPSQMAENAKEN